MWADFCDKYSPNAEKQTENTKEIFLTKCCYCNKRIAVKVFKDGFTHNTYSCNQCVPKDNCARNGIDEALETDLYDEYDI